MAPSVYLIALPMLSFFFLLTLGSRMSKAMISTVGALGIATASMFAVFLFSQSLSIDFERQTLWTLLPDMGFGLSSIEFALWVDSLSLTMCMVVTNVSLWIALYSSEYMANEEGLSRFFAVINLFVGFMLILVLADNLWLLFMGWEGVGICSYLLIGFYYREKGAELAAMKAFLTTRVGDVFLLFGMFVCGLAFHTLDIQEILLKAQTLYPDGSTTITVIAFCLLLGAVGKSAQLPLQTWLPDAMWGPTPVSALIHAATMVTAGVYLIARMSKLFALSAEAQMAVVIIGGATLVLAGLCALVQTDLKRVLAYSTMSQIGYMFLALGVKAPKAAIFHLVTHAFFKALLFLSAGVIGHALHTYDMRKMGDLRRQMPKIFWLFVIGCLSLVGVPFISSGFFSKEWILAQAFHVPEIGLYAYGVGMFGALLTGLYTTRMIMLVFFSNARTKAHDHGGLRTYIPLYLLAIFSIVIGWLEVPQVIAPINLMSDYLSTSLSDFGLVLDHGNILVLIVPTAAMVLGVLLAVWRYGNLPLYIARLEKEPTKLIALLKNGGGLDWLYLKTFVSPYVLLSKKAKNDFLATWISWLIKIFNGLIDVLKALHTGNLSHYISFFVVAALALASVMVF